jgi:hypothetical protein
MISRIPVTFHHRRGAPLYLLLLSHSLLVLILEELLPRSPLVQEARISPESYLDKLERVLINKGINIRRHFSSNEEGVSRRAGEFTDPSRVYIATKQKVKMQKIRREEKEINAQNKIKRCIHEGFPKPTLRGGCIEELRHKAEWMKRCKGLLRHA